MMGSHKASAARESGTRLIAKLPALLQNDITVHCPGDQPGNVYSARVLGVDGDLLRVSLPRRIAGNGYLRSSARVILNFVIGQTLYEAPAEYHADNNHVRELVITGEIKETTRRNFVRMSLKIHAGYVPVSDLRLARGHFASLPWKRCVSLDLSAGGILLQIPFQAPVNSYFLLNLEIPIFQGPLFIFGQVRWVDLSDVARKLYSCGIRFVPREDLGQHLSSRALAELPPIMIAFDDKKQRELDVYLKMQSGHKMQGDENDDEQNPE